MEITRPDGLVTREQAATIARVDPDTISQWAHRGYLKVARREGRTPLYEPADVIECEYERRIRGRHRVVVRAA